MLVDAGTNESGGTVTDYLHSLNLTKLDYLIGTHPHEDHIGGLDDVILSFDIGTVIMPTYPIPPGPMRTCWTRC